MTAKTPADIWLQHVLDEEIEPLYRKLRNGKTTDQDRRFFSPVQGPAHNWWPIPIAVLVVAGSISFLR